MPSKRRLRNRVKALRRKNDNLRARCRVECRVNDQLMRELQQARHGK